MKSPKMPENLPPLPIGSNGKPLVPCGFGGTFDHDKSYTLTRKKKHSEGWINNCNGILADVFYFAESDSTTCKLNGWGDFEEPDNVWTNPPLTRLEAYRAAIRSEREEAKKMSAEADEVAEQWRIRLAECVQAESALTPSPDAALSRKAWFERGKKVERTHGKSPTCFPLWPQDEGAQ